MNNILDMIDIIIPVMGNVVSSVLAHYVIRWLERDRHDNNNDGHNEAGQH